MILKEPEACVLGLLEMLWQTAHESTNPVMPRDDIEIAAGWYGDIGVLLDALIASKWVDERTNGDVELHDYWENCPDYVWDRRRKKRERQRRKESIDVMEQSKAKEDKSTTQPDASTESLDASTLPNPTDPTQPTHTTKENQERESVKPGPNGPTTATAAAECYFLQDFPILSEFYPKLWEMISASHSSVSAPKAGSRVDTESMRVLAMLARTDGFNEQDIVDSLAWLFESEADSAEFWRKQVASVPPLRKKCKTGLTKFAAVHEAWKEYLRKPTNKYGKPKLTHERERKPAPADRNAWPA
jgi:hypothetical protein